MGDLGPLTEFMTSVADVFGFLGDAMGWLYSIFETLFGYGKSAAEFLFKLFSKLFTKSAA
jgi:hypothetical protein